MGAGISSESFASSRGPFKPNAGDVRLAHAYLSSPGLLPPELAWVVLEYAEYWITETSHLRGQLPTVSAGVPGNQQQMVALRTSPIQGGGPSSGLVKCCRRVSVLTVSKDQGFSSFPQAHGTREASTSWFELALIRPASPPPGASSSPPRQSWRVVTRVEVIRNIHAGRDFAEATTVFRRGDAIVDEARRGDRLVLFALAQYPLWSNTVKKCGIVVESMI